ncbi:MAG: hypothetical protein RBS73_06075 [Prolixibacteraceae bacterium]|jgi:uncharacterized protein YqgV (UPF0045/DUF77 family)|nr:hypothetical protein [Prolixibacteraceae bacterium]
MEISVEISYYSLTDDYKKPVKEFLGALQTSNNVSIEPGTMSSVITGQYDDVMKLLDETIKIFMDKYPSVFTLKISNACKTCK